MSDGYGGQVRETVEKTCECLFQKLANGYCGQGASERLKKLVKKTRNKLRNRQQHETTQAYLVRLLGQPLQIERMRHFQDVRTKCQILLGILLDLSKKMLMKRQAETAAEEVGDDMILQQIDAEEAAKFNLSAQPCVQKKQHLSLIQKL